MSEDKKLYYDDCVNIITFRINEIREKRRQLKQKIKDGGDHKIDFGYQFKCLDEWEIFSTYLLEILCPKMSQKDFKKLKDDLCEEK